MDKIEVKVLNPEAIHFGEKMMVFGSRLTQRGHEIKCMNDLMELFDRHYLDSTMQTMLDLPHANPKRFSQISMAVVGASRRFLAQITRHQDDCHFISASLQYSDYTNNAAFCVPYELFVKQAAGNERIIEKYLTAQRFAMSNYEMLIENGVEHDTAGYVMPHGLRNILLITATPFQWIHMISQRTCRRNTCETQYVMLLIWERLAKESDMFKTLPAPDCCQHSGCREGLKFGCGHAFRDFPVKDYMVCNHCSLPTAFLDVNYPLIRTKKGDGENV